MKNVKDGEASGGAQYHQLGYGYDCSIGEDYLKRRRNGDDVHGE